jgi:DNA polymerase-1
MADGRWDRQALLLDGPSLLYRASFALPDTIRDRHGRSVHAAYGFMAMVIRLLQDHDPSTVGIAWDPSDGSFRNQLFAGYKHGRVVVPRQVRIDQREVVEEALFALGLPITVRSGFEADDVIASWALGDAAGRTQVVSGDRDLLQTIDAQRVRVLLTLRGVTNLDEWTQERFVGEYGFLPNRYPEFVALKGDKSDNISGVPGVGAKRARLLVSSSESLEELLASELFVKLTAPLTMRLADDVRAMTVLTTLRADLGVPAPQPLKINEKRLKSTLDRLGLQGLIARTASLTAAAGDSS